MALLNDCKQVKVQEVLGAFAKLREATISFGVSVFPPALMEQVGCHWRDFVKFDI